MKYRMVLGRNLLDEADVTIARGIPIITKQTTENGIIMIQDVFDEDLVKQLDSVATINNIVHKGEVMKMITHSVIIEQL